MATTTDSRPIDQRVDALVELADEQFDRAVYEYVRDRERTEDDIATFRDPDVVERTYEALRRLVPSVAARLAEQRTIVDRSPGDEEALRTLRYLTAIGHKLRAESGACKPLAGQAREERLADERGLSDRQRAAKILSQEPDLQDRYLKILREVQRKRRRT